MVRFIRPGRYPAIRLAMAAGLGATARARADQRLEIARMNLGAQFEAAFARERAITDMQRSMSPFTGSGSMFCLFFASGQLSISLARDEAI